MKRRAFLATVGSTGISGCLNLSVPQTGKSDEKETEARPIYKPAPETSNDPDWQGGYRSSISQGAAIYSDGARITVPFAYAHSQLGAYFDEPVEGNPEEIPDDEFKWVEASDATYIWTPYVELASEKRDYRAEVRNAPEQIPVERWTASGDLQDEEPEVLALATGFDEWPTYYRIISQAGTRTAPAYTFPESVRSGRYLAFELPARWVYIIYDGDVRADWAFDF